MTAGLDGYIFYLSFYLCCQYNSVLTANMMSQVLSHFAVHVVADYTQCSWSFELPLFCSKSKNKLFFIWLYCCTY